MKKNYLLILIISFFFGTILNSCQKGNVEIYEVTAVIENCSLPYIVNFEADLTYTGKEISYEWDFGDGTTSTDNNPQHIYTEVGAYNVKFTAQNYEDIAEETVVVDIHTESIPVISDYDYEIVYNSYAPAEIKFTNFSEHTDNFFWNFDDGLGSDDFETSHIFDTAGIYNVSLRAVCNGDTVYHTEAIEILPPPADIVIKRVSIWFPQEHLNKELDLQITYDVFDETPTALPSIIATSIPISWTMYEELFFFDGEYNSEQLIFEIWDDNNLSLPVYTFAITTYEIAENHFPEVLTWDDGNGYSAEVLIEYID